MQKKPSKNKKTHNQLPRRNIFKEQGQQCKTVIDVIDTNPVISVITLNINGLKYTNKKHRLSKKKNIVRVDQKTRLYVVYKKLNMKTFHID